MGNNTKAEVITIGMGDDIGICPFLEGEQRSWCEVIYPMSEFPYPCTISSISYYNAGIYGMMWPWPSMATSLNIYMGERESLSHSSRNDWTPLSDLTLVYSQENVVLGAECEWNEFVLDEPFTYEHDGNLVIVIAKTNPSPDWDFNFWVIQSSNVNSTLYKTSSRRCF